jgi:CHAT domain-containing protein/tetratricopeptide (TPR) repeat protein
MTASLRSRVWSWLGFGLLVALAGQVPADDAHKEQEIRKYFDRGQAAAEAGKPKEAIAAFERAVALQPGKVSRDTAIMLTMLGDLYSGQGDFDKAQDCFERAMKTWQALPRRSAEDLAWTLTNFASFCLKKEDYAKAESLHLWAKRIYEADNNKNPNALANLNNLGLLYNKIGEYAKAEQVLRQVVQAREPQGESTRLAATLYELAYTYKNLGQLDQAEALLQRALRIQEAKLGPDHRLVTDTLMELGSVYRRLKKYDQAAACYQRGIKTLEAKYGPDSPTLFFLIESSAALQSARGQKAEALATHQRSLKIAESRFGADHTYTAQVLRNIAASHQELKDPAKAEPFLQRALKIYESRLGAEHPDTIMTLEHLAHTYACSGRWEKSVAGYDRARRANRRYVARILPALSEAQQLTFLGGAYSSGYREALAVALARSADRTTVQRSAEWLLNGKVVMQQALAERSLLARGSNDPILARTIQELNAVRQQLAQLTLSAPKPGTEKAHQQELERLTAQEQELAKRLGRANGRPARDDPWVSLQEVQQALPKDAVLIEFAELRPIDFPTLTFQTGHFFAWVIPGAGQGEIKLVDLGESGPIEKAVQAVRDGFRAAQGSARQKSIIVEKGEAQAEKELQPALAALGKLILAPLAEQLDGKRHWILSPDSELWLVPWSALPLQDGSYAIEKHQISYVISGRDLVTPPFQGKVQSDGSVIMADPEFDIDPKEAAALTAKLLGKQPQPVNDDPRVALDSPQGNRAAALIGRVGRLPGTAAEAVAIKPKLQAYLGEEPWVYRGKNALEGVFKAFHSPKVVVLSTHGFFLEDQEVQTGERPAGDKQPTLTKNGKLPENPLLRCGLLLAGCNERARATGKQEDGVLTGLEIVGCDLRGTELVVLSACETGLGQVRNGEGVAGLRQAFQLAGAQTVVASLWQVSDRDTALLMSDFFDGLAKGNNKAEALREAQLARLKAHRDRDGAAHPFYWAAFTLTGR